MKLISFMREYKLILFVPMNWVCPIYRLYISCHILQCQMLLYYFFNSIAGDPDIISKVSGRLDVNYLDNWTNNDSIQLVNLM